MDFPGDFVLLAYLDALHQPQERGTVEFFQLGIVADNGQPFKLIWRRTMDKLKMETPDLTQTNIEKLVALFPACVTEAKGEGGKLKKAVKFVKV